jgi:hypothetical protein
VGRHLHMVRVAKAHLNLRESWDAGYKIFVRCEGLHILYVEKSVACRDLYDMLSTGSIVAAAYSCIDI